MEESRNQNTGYGLCLSNPVRLTSIPLEYIYLGHIISPAGTPFVPNGRRYTCTGMIDCHCGYYLDALGKEVETNIYISAYSRENDIRPPAGWTMSAMEIPKATRRPSAEKKGCIVPFVLTIGSLIFVSVVACCIIF